MKLFAAIFSLAIILVGCGRKNSALKDPDAETRRKLVGNWTVWKWANESGREWLHSNTDFTIVFGADGSFESAIEKRINGRTNHLLSNGIWKLKSNELFFTATNVSGDLEHEPVGNEDHFTIMRLNHDELVYLYTNQPQTIFLKRKE